MKRCVFGAGLLLVLLFVSFAVTMGARHAPREISRELTLAARSALDGDWQKTTALTERAGAAWKETRSMQARLHHRDQITEIDGLFARLEVCRETEDREETAELCLSLGTRTGELAQMQVPRLPGPGQ